MNQSEEMIGRRFGKLIVRKFLSRSKKGCHFECECDCGGLRRAVAYNLKSGIVKDCGCANRRCKFIDETGNRYGFLTVIKRVPANGKAVFECLCVCGNRTTVTGTHLRGGNTGSCGCKKLDLIKENQKAIGRRVAAKGRDIKSMWPEYKIWRGMKDRCHLESTEAYASYGAIGIYVCDEWRNSFDRFYEDMGSRPSDKHSIDRINNDLGYSKENCRWATKAQQCENRRVAVLVEYLGEIVNVSVAARAIGAKYSYVHGRVKRGRSMDEIVIEWNNRSKCG